MSELTDLVIQFGREWGWEVVLFLFVLYQLYWPEALHPSKPKARKLAEQIPSVLVVILEALAEETDNVDEKKVHDDLTSNGYHTDDYKVRPPVADGGPEEEE